MNGAMPGSGAQNPCLILCLYNINVLGFMKLYSCEDLQYWGTRTCEMGVRFALLYCWYIIEMIEINILVNVGVKSDLTLADGLIGYLKSLKINHDFSKCVVE